VQGERVELMKEVAVDKAQLSANDALIARKLQEVKLFFFPSSFIFYQIHDLDTQHQQDMLLLRSHFKHFSLQVILLLSSTTVNFSLKIVKNIQQNHNALISNKEIKNIFIYFCNNR
jgi:hypothetical protein